MQQAPSQSVGGASELRSDAQQITNTAANRVHSEVDARKGAAAQQAKSVSSALERAGGELDAAPAWLKSAFEQGAQQIQRFADAIEQKDSRELVGQVETFARERPGAFLLGCAAAGFAAARIFKAGGQQGSTGSADYQPETAFGESSFGGEASFQTATPQAGSPARSPGEFV